MRAGHMSSLAVIQPRRLLGARAGAEVVRAKCCSTGRSTTAFSPRSLFGPSLIPDPVGYVPLPDPRTIGCHPRFTDHGFYSLHDPHDM